MQFKNSPIENTKRLEIVKKKKKKKSSRYHLARKVYATSHTYEIWYLRPCDITHQLHHVVLPHQAALGVGLQREATARHRALDLLHLVLVLTLPLHLVQLVGERLEFGERELEGESVVVVAGRVLQQVLKG